MTTLIAFRTNTAVFIAADSQLTSGHIKYALPFKKILRVGEKTLIGITGSLGMLQQMIKRSLKIINVSKIEAEAEDFEIHPKELAKTLADLNFEMPLQHKAFSPCGYLIVGTDDEKDYILSVESEGSVIDIPNYHADGSGSELALSQLSSRWKSELTDEEGAHLCIDIFSHVTQHDVYTNDRVQAFMVKEGKIFEIKESQPVQVEPEARIGIT